MDKILIGKKSHLDKILTLTKFSLGQKLPELKSLFVFINKLDSYFFLPYWMDLKSIDFVLEGLNAISNQSIYFSSPSIYFHFLMGDFPIEGLAGSPHPPSKSCDRISPI